MDKIEGRPNLKEKLDHYRIPILQKGSQSFICCPHPNHSDKNPSCQINLNQPKETFFCHACGAKGDIFDLISLVELRDLKDVLREYSYTENISFREVSNFNEETQKKENFLVSSSNGSYNEISREYIKGANNPNMSTRESTSNSPFFQALSHEELNNFPKRRLKYLAQNFLKGYQYAEKLTDYSVKETYPFLSSSLNPLGAMLRLESPEGKKIFMQTTLGRDTRNGKVKLFGFWHPKEKILPFGSEKITEQRQTIVITEGQKASKALQRHNTHKIASLGLFGVNSSLKNIDFSPLDGKKVYLWADNDKIGNEFMEKLKSFLEENYSLNSEVLKIDWIGKQDKDDAFDFLRLRKQLGRKFSWREIFEKNSSDIKCFMPDKDNNGKPLDTQDNFSALIHYYNLKAGVDVFDKKAGLFYQDNTLVSDADLITFCRKTGFPKADRVTFVEDRAQNGLYINRFRETLESINLSKDKKYMHEILKHVKFRDDFLSHLDLNAKEKQEIIEKAWRTWLSCVYYQGTHEDKESFVFRNVLIFHGPQNIGKTRFFDKITPKGLFLEGTGFPENEDDKHKVTRSLITEIGEFDTMTGREINKAKAFISNASDSYRRKYGREHITYPRMTTFVATTNKSVMLKDSENTRFWLWEIVAIDYKGINKLLESEEDVWNLWKEVSAWYGGRKQLFEDIKWMNMIFKEQNEKFRLNDATEELLEDAFDSERMAQGNFDGYLQNRKILALIRKDTSYQPKHNEEFAVPRFMEKWNLRRISVRVKPKKNISAQKIKILMYPVALKQEYLEWIAQRENFDIFIR